MSFMHAWALALGFIGLSAPVAVHFLTRPMPVPLQLTIPRFSALDTSGCGDDRWFRAKIGPGQTNAEPNSHSRLRLRLRPPRRLLPTARGILKLER